MTDRPDAISWDDLSAAGVAVPEQVFAYEPEDAFALLGRAGRVCVKADTSLHKTQMGLVAVSVDSERGLRDAFRRLQARCRDLGQSESLLVQEQVEGSELIVGGRRDPVFGPVVLFGLGGTAAERLATTSVRLAPVTMDEAERMVAEAVGQPDESLASVIVAVGRLLVERPAIGELDLNPVIVTERGPIAVDLRVVPGDSHGPVNAVTGSQAAVRRILEPRAVAVIGASADASKAGGMVVANILRSGADVQLHLVNPKGGTIAGLPVLRGLDELPPNVDVAVIATSADKVESALAGCADRGIPAAIVLAGGFGEAGNTEAEARIAEIARQSGVRVCGVNTIGVIGAVPLTFTKAVGEGAVDGDVSYVTQSGALGGSLLVRSWSAGLGTARYVCVGNQTDLEMADYLDYLAGDQRTRVVGLFVEGMRDGRRFRDALQRLHKAGKPVVAVRAGRSEISRLAARSHTGVLAGSDRIFRQVFRETGVVGVDDLPQLVAACQALSWQPCARGRRVGIIATSGGACSLLCDFASRAGLDVPELEPAIQRELREVLPGYAPTRNPLDTTGQVVGDPSLFGRMAEIASHSGVIDVLLVAISTLVDEAADRIVADLIALSEVATQPIVVGWSLPERAVGHAFERLRRARIPVFDSYSVAVVAASALAIQEVYS